MTMPAQNPTTSEQTVTTPWEFIDAVEARFGKLTFDLAADKANTRIRARSTAYSHFSAQEDALSKTWMGLGNMWLNPPFSRPPIAKWAAKCVAEINRSRAENIGNIDRILMLTPASVGANWFWDYVWGNATVIMLSPRLTFEGHSDPYPKDLMLSVFGGFGTHDKTIERWQWKMNGTSRGGARP